MNRRRISNVIGKEWRLLFTDINSALLVTLLPLAIVGQGILYIWLAYRFGGSDMLGSAVFQNALEKLATADASVLELEGRDSLLVLLLHQFTFFILLIPTMIAVSVATFSIVDEKTSGSLEALLATPVRTWELLLAKSLSGLVPAMLMTWVSAGVFVLSVIALGWWDIYRYVISGSWFVCLFLLAPAVTMLSFQLGVIGSSRAKDARSAQTKVVLIVLPVLALILLQVTGVIWFTTERTVMLAFGVLAIDGIVLRLAVRLFQRESIVIAWR